VDISPRIYSLVLAALLIGVGIVWIFKAQFVYAAGCVSTAVAVAGFGPLPASPPALPNADRTPLRKHPLLGPMGGVLLMVLSMVGATLCFHGCSASQRQQELAVGIDVIDIACVIVPFLDDSGTVKTLCATLEELTPVIQQIVADRTVARAMARRAECTIVPYRDSAGVMRTVCATAAELGPAMRQIAAARSGVDR